MLFRCWSTNLLCWCCWWEEQTEMRTVQRFALWWSKLNKVQLLSRHPIKLPVLSYYPTVLVWGSCPSSSVDEPAVPQIHLLLGPSASSSMKSPHDRTYHPLSWVAIATNCVSVNWMHPRQQYPTPTGGGDVRMGYCIVVGLPPEEHSVVGRTVQQFPTPKAEGMYRVVLLSLP